MKDSLVEGLTTTRRIAIDAERTTGHMGDELRVYSTPSMALDIERTCRDWMLAHLDDGEDTVGARIEIDHLGATLLGMWVEVRAAVAGVDGRRVTLEIEVRDELDRVGAARHVRFVIDKERQRRRLEAKAARLREPGGQGERGAR